MNSFSVFDRPEIIKQLASKQFDLLIIGGGITGAGIALDAASRGLKTALIEKNDFAFGTSSRSTKLIHGGLRYLKQLEFGLVKEVGSERAIVHRLAPHLVIPEKMLLPLSEKKGLGYWLTSVGLKIYDWLAGVKSIDQRKMLTQQQTLFHEPLLRNEDVVGGAIYAEYRTDDARLTLEIIKAAAAHGAQLLSYCQATDFIYVEESLAGVVATDQLDTGGFLIRATSIVNAAGPWVDDLRLLNKSNHGRRLRLTKGAHIVVPHVKLPVQQAIYFNVDDGRMIFAIPRGRITYVGTTDTFYDGDKDSVFTTREDVGYLLKAVNATFRSVQLTLSDVESSWAGLRPLIYEEGKSASELSRKDEIFESSSGLISIAGGKLTGYRKMAERVVDLVEKKYFKGRNLDECKTHLLKLPGAFNDSHDVGKFVTSLNEKLISYNMPPGTATYLTEVYGSQARDILNIFSRWNQHDNPELALLKAELEFCIRSEMTCTLLDFFVRRTGLANFNIHRVIEYKTEIALAFQQFAEWTDDRRIKELNQLDTFLLSITEFKQ